MAMTEQEHREYIKRIDAGMARRKKGRAAYEENLRRRLERGETITEHVHGRSTRYSLAHPGPFVHGQSASYIARHIASRHYGFGSRVTFSHSKGDPGKRRPAVRIPPARRAAVSRRVRELVAAGYSTSAATRKAYHEGRATGDPASGSRGLHRFRVSYRGLDGKDHHYDVRSRSREDAMSAAYMRHGHEPYVSGSVKVHAIHHVRRRGERDASCSRDCVGIHTHESLAGHAVHYMRDPGRLTAAQRRGLRPSDFALPGRRQLPLRHPGGDPVETKRIIRNAAARLSQMHQRGTITESEYRRALARVRRAEKRHGIHHRRAKESR